MASSALAGPHPSSGLSEKASKPNRHMSRRLPTAPPLANRSTARNPSWHQLEETGRLPPPLRAQTSRASSPCAARPQASQRGTQWWRPNDSSARYPGQKGQQRTQPQAESTHPFARQPRPHGRDTCHHAAVEDGIRHQPGTTPLRTEQLIRLHIHQELSEGDGPVEHGAGRQRTGKNESAAGRQTSSHRPPAQGSDESDDARPFRLLPHEGRSRGLSEQPG